jgi:RsiW-degrading membrane proteinase PrsW (M82 family)
MGLLALAIAPGLAICFYIFYKDRYNHEPFLNLFVSFVLGIVSAVPAILFQLLLTKPVERLLGETVLFTFIFSYFIVAFSEEFCKYFMLRFYAYRRKAYDEPLDGIVYAVMVGMGFATIENIGYVLQHGYATGIVRMFLSVPAHGTFAVLMGYYVGLAKFNPPQSLRYLVLGVFGAVFFHGTFDFFLFLKDIPLLAIGAIASFIVALRLSRKAISYHQDLSRNQQLNQKAVQKDL